MYREVGIFKNLEGLKAGDTFEVEFGDLSRRQFQVISVQSYSVKDVAEHMLDQNPDTKKQLNLIACGGRFEPKTEQYQTGFSRQPKSQPLDLE
jgi:sortase (surface protein transpeptidase)